MLNDNCNETAQWKFDDETWRNSKSYWLQSYLEIQNSTQIGEKHLVLCKCKGNNQLSQLSQQTLLLTIAFPQTTEVFLLVQFWANNTSAFCPYISPLLGPIQERRTLRVSAAPRGAEPDSSRLSLYKVQVALESEEPQKVLLLPWDLFSLT